mmetsp:Transcript_91721/g.201085  ORF Transcript_91721/g.201085 Transcript_91721/m.201085 type:complete len:281 (+) Transcript_91721:76-918(+)
MAAQDKVEVPDENRFYFCAKSCEEGAGMKVQAPDGVMLIIPIPKHVLDGDEIYMMKGSDGEWKVEKIVRPTIIEVPAVAPAEPQWRSQAALEQDCSSPEAVAVRFETTKGPIVVKVVPSWAPLGAKRFLDLVDDGYFSDIAIYRAIDRGLLQFGVVKSTDPRSTRYDRIPDDRLVGIPYAEGVIGFAAAGPGTRKSTICIMKADFRTQLGKGAHGTPSTETPFGMVAPESMATMHAITCIGDIPQLNGTGADPAKLEQFGNDYIHQEFPSCDFIISASRA